MISQLLPVSAIDGPALPTAATAHSRQLAELRSIADIPYQNPSPIVRIGANQQQLYANPAARKIGQGLVRAQKVCVQRQLRAAAASALAQGEAHEMEVSMGPRTFCVAVMPFVVEGYVNMYFADITEREAVRRELNEQQQFMQQVLDTIPSLVFVRDAARKVIFQNKAMQAIFQASCLAQATPPLPGSAPAAQLAGFAAADNRVLTTGQEVETEEQFTLTNGQVNWFYTVKRLLRRADGTLHVLGVSTNITAQKQAQHTLERSEKQYRDLITYSQAFIFTHDLQGLVLSLNPAVAQLLHRPAEELLGEHFSTNLPPEDAPAFAEYLARIATTPETQGLQRILLRGSQEIRYLHYRSFRVEEPGQSPYIIVHAHDITERILAGKELKRAKLEAEAAVRARENFLANMSHEIRTPMNGVLGVANLLAKTSLTPEQQDLLRIIRSSGQHLLAVLNDVLDMAKIASGKLEFNIESFNLCDSVGLAIQPLALQAVARGIQFEGTPLSASCPYPMVQADAHRLNQIMINLVSNAIKFTPAGSRVQVKSELLAETADTLTVQFRVTDTGIGMEPDVLARIFESFTQAYADTARRFGGTGLGLSISRALVEQMGGQLVVESTYGVGSSFGFALTLTKAPSPVIETEPEEVDTGALRGVQVLLVEDNDINRFVARRTMQEWGVVVTEAEDGHQGVQKFEQRPYDVVLMDIQMPGMSGLEATTLIRAHADRGRACVPILALTANAFRADHEHYLATGMNDCLAKPFDEAQLYAKLLKLLRR